MYKYKRIDIGMKLKKVDIKNFRLLSSVSLDIEDELTLIVGKNNTGKTSLFEAVNIFTSESANRRLSFVDFSQSTYVDFRKYLELYNTLDSLGEEEREVKEKQICRSIPRIEVRLEFEYCPQKDRLTELKDFIVDLDKNRTDVNILMSYEPTKPLLFYSALSREINDNKLDLIAALNILISSFYEVRNYAVDSKSEYKNLIDKGFIASLSRIVSFDDIRAQRVMDDVKEDSNHSLTNSFAKYYSDKEQKDQDIRELEEVLKEVANTFKTKYTETLKRPLEEIAGFGAKTPLVIPEITIESEFSAEKALKQNIKYGYKREGVFIPESNNGLGYSNLIFMILEFLSFLKKFKQSLFVAWNEDETKVINQNAKTLVIMIEEPESHMHPQMQQLFTKRIKHILKRERDTGLDIQIIISTHSSHVIAESGIDQEKGFQQLRFFGRDLNDKHFHKDFNSFKVDDGQKETFRFLQKYLTLHKCDLFFADKVIMVEGLTERLLLPVMIKKVAPQLNEEYLTVIEIGGAYAHKFKEFLEFIKIKTLVITDLDSMKKNGVKCPVKDGVLSSNSVLKEWMPGTNVLDALMTCSDEGKIHNNTIRIAYQNAEKEDDYVARSFEEAFIRANKELLKRDFEKEGKRYHVKNQFSLFRSKKITTLEDPYISSPSNSAKSNFAFDILCFDENEYGEWTVPNYIKEGLEWLVK